MAIVTLSGLVTHIKGSISGSTFQNSGSGLTVRKKPLAVGIGTNAQHNVRNLQSRLNFAWLQLTDAQRTQWSAFAVYCNGQGKTNKSNRSANTGKMQFIAVNFWCLQYSKAIITTPIFDVPNNVAIPCPESDTESDNLGNTSYNLDTSQEILVTRVSLPQSNATKTANTGFRSLVYSQVDGYVQSWAAEYKNVYGIDLKTGYKYWIQLQVVNFIKGTISPVAKKLIKYTEPDMSLTLIVDTTKAGSASNTFILPCYNIGTYNATIDWGDDSTSTITAYNDANLTHVYAVGGTYTIKISGTLPSIYFAQAGDKLKLLDITQWGNWQPLFVVNAFGGCANLVGTFSDSLNLSSCTSLQAMFAYCTHFTGDVSNWNVSNITIFATLFTSCTNFNSNISNWDMSAATNISLMLRTCPAFNQDISIWNISNVTNAASFMQYSHLSTSNYDALLIAWALLPVKSGVSINFGTSVYTIATAGAARAILTGSPNNWTITDGGGI